MAKNLLWHPAKDLAYTGRAIRRDAWRKWLVPSTVIWFIERTDADGNALKYVVPQLEFTDKEFLAGDWTDEPWIDPITGLPVIPPTFPPLTPPGSPPPTHSPFPWGGPDNPSPFIIGGSPPPPPPPVRPPFTPPDTPPSGDTPVVKVTFDFGDPDFGKRCLLDDPMTPVKLYFTVSIEGGPAGVGPLSVSCQGQTQLDTGFRGFNKDFGFPSIEISAGSNVDCTATYTVNGTPYSDTGTAHVPATCGSCEPSRGCCPGETGHACGSFGGGPGVHDCCCCPVNEAPILPDCACIFVG